MRRETSVPSYSFLTPKQDRWGPARLWSKPSGTAWHTKMLGAVKPTLLDEDGSTYRSLRREPAVSRAIGDALMGQQNRRAARLVVVEAVHSDRQPPPP